MGHVSENSTRLVIRYFEIGTFGELIEHTRGFDDVCVLWLPSCGDGEYGSRLQRIENLARCVAGGLGPEATLVTLGEVIDLVQVQAALASSMRYQLWVAIKRMKPKANEELNTLPQYHFGALVHTKYAYSLRHAKTRVEYSYCPACDKTTKDYGGKKHTYHEYGTLMSDVWRDIECELDSDVTAVIDRFSDLLGIHPYQELHVLDCRSLGLKRGLVEPSEMVGSQLEEMGRANEGWTDKLIVGDCLEELRSIPDNSVDFAFADPPYNLKKHYTGYCDDMTISEYFDWCDNWIGELARVLRPGRTCAVLNIPIWAIRHFLFMERILNFQCWIAWEALGFPVH